MELFQILAQDLFYSKSEEWIETTNGVIGVCVDSTQWFIKEYTIYEVKTWRVYTASGIVGFFLDLDEAKNFVISTPAKHPLKGGPPSEGYTEQQVETAIKVAAMQNVTPDLKRKAVQILQDVLGLE